MDPLSVGRNYYKSKDYEGALAAFSKVVEISTGHILLTALDHRAATLEKLNRLQPALSDAREMIQQKPELAKGYLRCAKILRLKGEDGLALKIYERGLRKVKIGGDPDRPLLQEMFLKLEQNNTPAKTFDPMVMLPPELAQMVCEHLAMRDRVICLAVSKPWRHFLEASHDLWMVFDVRSAKRLVTLDSLKAHLRRSNYELDKAILKLQPRIFNVKNLEVLTQLAKKLSHLEISHTVCLVDSLLAALRRAHDLRVLVVRHAEIPLDVVATALSYCPGLTTAEFDNVTIPFFSAPPLWTHTEALTSLSMEITTQNIPREISMDPLISSTPNLRSVTLIFNGTYRGSLIMSNRYVDLSLWSNLEHLELSNIDLPNFPRLPKTLNYLDLSRSRVNKFMSESKESLFIMTLALLQTFISPEFDILPLDGFQMLIEPSVKAGHLKSLSVTTTFLLQSFFCFADGFSMPSVETLVFDEFDGGSTITENELLIFLRMCPRIQYLDVSKTDITGIAIKELMTRETPPKWIVADICTRLSPDAVEWARSLGARVQYNQQRKTKSHKHTWRDRVRTWGEAL